MSATACISDRMDCWCLVFRITKYIPYLADAHCHCYECKLHKSGMLYICPSNTATHHQSVSFIPFYFRPLARKKQKKTHKRHKDKHTHTDTNQTNELRKLLTNLLHEVDQLISKAYLRTWKNILFYCSLLIFLNL